MNDAELPDGVHHVTLIDAELLRFDEIWAAAGHPNGVFKLSVDQLRVLTGAPVADVTPDVVPSPCIDVCLIDEAKGWCAGCWRTLDEIAAWPTLSNEGKRVVGEQIAQRRAASLSSEA